MGGGITRRFNESGWGSFQGGGTSTVTDVEADSDTAGEGSGLSDSLQNLGAAELLDLGWIVKLDEDNNGVIGVQSKIHHWNNLPWAVQTFYRAKYGFSGRGLLHINLSRGGVSSRGSLITRHPPQRDQIVVPPNQLPGAGERLRRILAKTRVRVANYRYDDVGLVHFGPDDTVILTLEFLWALASPRDNELGEYDERFACLWEGSADNWDCTAPWWARGPDGEELSWMFDTV